MNIIQYIEQYLTIDNILEYSSIILLALVAWTFWGKSWVIEKTAGLSKKHKDLRSK